MRRTAESDPIFELRNVEAKIEGHTILHDVDWTVRVGEHWGIVGANGSGKTTLLALVSGQRWPAPGRGMRRYRFDGVWHRDAVEARRRITLVGPELQDYYTRLGWNFSALAVVLTGIHRTEIPRRRAAAAERRQAAALLDELGAGELGERAFLTLSHGEQRRVLIARALAFNPDLLLLDEPASGLDERARQTLERLIDDAAKRTTIIAAAHTDTQLPAIVARVAEITNGALRVQMRVERPRHPALDPQIHADGAAAPSTRTREPLIDIRGADVWIGERRVLEAIDWQLHPGEHWLVRGHNGAGKTSFLRLLHGQLRPALGGTIRWPGLGSPRSVWALRELVAWVSPELQASYLFPTTVLACIASGFTSSIGQTRAPSRAERARCEQLLRELDLEALRDRDIAKLSYGQKRRVLLARTLARKPRILLLDEPWEGLDPITAALVRDRLRDAMRAGTQIVCASHTGDMGLGLNRELVLENGAIRARGRADGTGEPA